MESIPEVRYRFYTADNFHNPSKSVNCLLAWYWFVTQVGASSVTEIVIEVFTIDVSFTYQVIVV